MIPASILVPILDNDGEPLAEGSFRELGERLITLAGGYTRRDNVVGAWRDDDGTIYQDSSFEFEVSVESWRDIGAFLEVADWALGEFRQLAMYVKVAGLTEILRS